LKEADFSRPVGRVTGKINFSVRRLVQEAGAFSPEAKTGGEKEEKNFPADGRFRKPILLLWKPRLGEKED
jgi:hypothetical protein